MHESRELRAMAIAAGAHAGQSGKDGQPFVEHLRRVARQVEGEQARTVAWLHDIVEKAPGWDLAALRREGFDDRVVAAVDAMTRREGEAYLDHASRAAEDPLARRVKRADLLDHVATSTAAGRSPDRYREALAIVEVRDRAAASGARTRKEKSIMDPREPKDDLYARRSFSMRRMAGWQLWGVSAFVALLVVLAIIWLA